MQDSLTMLCCGAVFGVLAVVVVLALLKRGAWKVTPTSSAPSDPLGKSVEGKHRVQTKSVEGKHVADVKSVEGKHTVNATSVASKHVAESVESKKGPLTKTRIEPASTKSVYHSAGSNDVRSKSVHKKTTATDDAEPDSPHLRKD